MQSLIPDLGIPTAPPTTSSQQAAFLLGGRRKKYKHGKNYHKQRKQFSLFVLSVDGMIGEKAQDLLE